MESEDELRRLAEHATRTGMELAVDRINGHWRAGFLVTNGVEESVFALHATGPDEGTAIRRLAGLIG